MILLIHENGRLKKVLHNGEASRAIPLHGNMAEGMFAAAREFPDKLIVWCDLMYAEQLNVARLENIFHHKRVFCSYSVSNKQFINDRIGYIESTPFINLKYDVTYPTWLMSADIGGVHAEVLNRLKESLFGKKDFDYFLNSLAKSVMAAGIFCYSEPSLLDKDTISEGKQREIPTTGLFRFVKQHYKTHWLYLLFWAFVFFEKRVPLLPLIKALFTRRIKIDSAAINNIEFDSVKTVSVTDTYDVLIPTIGRKRYLYDFLKDLTRQSQLPSNVIIIEQNPDVHSTTELDYLKSESWPFKIIHRFTHQAGACQARNSGFTEVRSEWLVLGDDDLRVAPGLFKQMLAYAREYGTNVLTASCLKPGEEQTYLLPGQTTIFGSGSSLLKASLLKDVRFDTRYEFGFAEDIDFGMQLRNRGEDIIYCPYVHITHLKAPAGGFRTKFRLPWEGDKIQPLPSPTVLLYNLKHRTYRQLMGYKLLYFIRYYKKQPIRNPFRYLKTMKQKWYHSKTWATSLLEKAP